jgi:hypothetical protein
MSKTPEELAEEYANNRCGNWEECERDNEWEEAKRGFVAGYKAAKDQLLAQFQSLLLSYAETSFNPSHTAWQIFDTLKEGKAAKDQLADVDKVIIPKENCEAAMKAMQSAQKLSEQAITWMKTLPPASERCNQCACEGYRAGYQAAAPQWISVKERLPEIDDTRISDDVLLINEYGEMGVSALVAWDDKITIDWGEAGDLLLEDFTHWMPLPQPPKEEG